MDTLPLEILLHIASTHYRVWRGMLTVRTFARYTMTKNCREYVIGVFSSGDQYTTTLCGKPHSYFDQPAIVKPEMPKIWCKHGIVHRGNNLPAATRDNGRKLWIEKGVLVWHEEGIKHLGESEYDKSRDLNIYRRKTEPAKICTTKEIVWCRAGLLGSINPVIKINTTAKLNLLKFTPEYISDVPPSRK